MISEGDFRRLKQTPKLSEVKMKVTGYSGVTIPVKGKCVANVKYKNAVYRLSFAVVPKESM